MRGPTALSTFAIAAAVVAPGCYGPAGDDSDEAEVVHADAAGGDRADVSTDAASDRVPESTGVTMRATPNEITESEKATFTVRLDGDVAVDDIESAELVDESREFTYAEFGKKGGLLVVDVSWAQINGARPISFEKTAERRFLARLRTAAGRTLWGRTRLTLSCGDQPACRGTCGKLECRGSCRPWSSFRDDPDNCGGCGTTCPDSIECSDFQCDCPGGGTVCSRACVDTSRNEEHCGQCENACAPDQVCVGGTCKNSDFGKACNSNSECSSERCPGGSRDSRAYCVVTCDERGSCPKGGVCVSELGSLCLLKCDGDGDCPGRTTCWEVPDGSEKVCFGG